MLKLYKVLDFNTFFYKLLKKTFCNKIKITNLGKNNIKLDRLEKTIKQGFLNFCTAKL